MKGARDGRGKGKGGKTGRREDGRERGEEDAHTVYTPTRQHPLHLAFTLLAHTSCPQAPQPHPSEPTSSPHPLVSPQLKPRASCLGFPAATPSPQKGAAASRPSAPHLPRSHAPPRPRQPGGEGLVVGRGRGLVVGCGPPGRRWRAAPRGRRRWQRGRRGRGQRRGRRGVRRKALGACPSHPRGSRLAHRRRGSCPSRPEGLQQQQQQGKEAEGMLDRYPEPPQQRKGMLQSGMEAAAQGTGAAAAAGEGS